MFCFWCAFAVDSVFCLYCSALLLCHAHLISLFFPFSYTAHNEMTLFLLFLFSWNFFKMLLLYVLMPWRWCRERKKKAAAHGWHGGKAKEQKEKHAHTYTHTISKSTPIPLTSKIFLSLWCAFFYFNCCFLFFFCCFLPIFLHSNFEVSILFFPILQFFSAFPIFSINIFCCCCCCLVCSMEYFLGHFIHISPNKNDDIFCQGGGRGDEEMEIRLSYRYVS